MALSDYERQMLADLEAQLSSEDAGLADALRAEQGAPGQWAISPKNLVLGLIVAMLGLLVVLAGVAFEIVLIGVAGVAVVFFGFWYISLGFVKRAGKNGAARRGSPKTGTGSTFMERQAQEWLRRMQEGNKS